MGSAAGDDLPGLGEIGSCRDALTMAVGAELGVQLLPLGHLPWRDDVLSQPIQLCAAQCRLPGGHIQMKTTLCDDFSESGFFSGEGDSLTVAGGAIYGEQALAIGGDQEVQQLGAFVCLQCLRPVGQSQRRVGGVVGGLLKRFL